MGDPFMLLPQAAQHKQSQTAKREQSRRWFRNSHIICIKLKDILWCPIPRTPVLRQDVHS